MLRYGKLLRLTDIEDKRLFKLTGSKPNAIHTIADLNRYIDFHLGQYDETKPESQLLCMLLKDVKIVNY